MRFLFLVTDSGEMKGVGSARGLGDIRVSIEEGHGDLSSWEMVLISLFGMVFRKSRGTNSVDEDVYTNWSARQYGPLARITCLDHGSSMAGCMGRL